MLRNGQPFKGLEQTLWTAGWACAKDPVEMELGVLENQTELWAEPGERRGRETGSGQRLTEQIMFKSLFLILRAMRGTWECLNKRVDMSDWQWLKAPWAQKRVVWRGHEIKAGRRGGAWLSDYGGVVLLDRGVYVLKCIQSRFQPWLHIQSHLKLLRNTATWDLSLNILTQQVWERRLSLFLRNKW